MKFKALVFVEDPGAANYGFPLVAPLGADLWIPETLAAYATACGYTPTRLTSSSTASLPEDINVLLVGTSENPETLAHDLVRQARERGIPSIGMIDFPANPSNRFRGGTMIPLLHAPDWLMVTDDVTASRFAGLGFPIHKIGIVGHPHFDKVLALRNVLYQEGKDNVRARLFPTVPKNQKIIVFLSEVSGGGYQSQYQRSKDYTLLGRGDRVHRTHIILQEFLDATDQLSPKPYRVLRLHPKNTAAEFEPMTSEFDTVNAGGNPLEVVFGADLICGMNTMLLYEAAMLGKATLSILPRDGDAKLTPTVVSGITPYATTRTNLRHLLQQGLDRVAVPPLEVAPALERAVNFVRTLTKDIFLEGKHANTQ